MTETGIVAIIVACVTAVGVVVAAWIKRPRQPQTSAAQTMAATTTTAIAENYGFSAKSAYSRVEILNAQGDSKTIRGWKGIKLKKGSSLPQIPGRVWVGTPGASIVKGPTLVNHTDIKKDISLVVRRKTATECEYGVEIPGNLTSDDPALDYEIELGYSKAIFMTRAETERAYANAEFKRDYHSFDVEYPIDNLELEITFPQGFGVSAFGGVFLARTETSNDSEFQRVKSGFERTSRGGRFSVSQPTVGFRYLIYWSLTN